MAEQSLQVPSFILAQVCPPLAFGLEVTFQAVPADITIDLPIRGSFSFEDASSRYLFNVSLRSNDRAD